MNAFAVTGGRRYKDQAFVDWALDVVHADMGITRLIHGATPTKEGADWMAEAWAIAHQITVVRVPAELQFDGRWPAAGPRRNYRMLKMERPIGVIAFPSDGTGTAGCIQIAKDLGIPVWDLRLPDTPYPRWIR